MKDYFYILFQISSNKKKDCNTCIYYLYQITLKSTYAIHLEIILPTIKLLQLSFFLLPTK